MPKKTQKNYTQTCVQVNGCGLSQYPDESMVKQNKTFSIEQGSLLLTSIN